MPEMKFRVERTANGWDGTVVLPFAVPQPGGGTGVAVTAAGPTKKEALLKAAGIAERVMANPVLSALLPPQAALALKAARVIAKSGLAKAALKYSGPAMSRLAKLFG